MQSHRNEIQLFVVLFHLVVGLHKVDDKGTRHNYNGKTCRRRADASHGKNLSFKSQVINYINVFVTIITSKIIMAYLMFVLLSN